MVLALAAGLVLGGTPVNTIWVSMSPDVTPCTLEVFAGAFHARLGHLAVVQGEHDVTTGEIQVVVRPVGLGEEKGLELRVHGTGQRELIRALPAPGSDCLAASETAALMVERYLDEVGDGVAVAAGPALGSLVKPAPPARWGFALEGAVAADLGVLPRPGPGEATTMPVLGVGGTIALGVQLGHWQLSVLGGLEPMGTTSVSGSVDGPPGSGSLHVQAGALALVLNYLIAAGPGAVRFELSPGAHIFSAGTQTSNGGQFGKTSDNVFNLLPFIGFGVGYEWPLWEHLSALAGVSMRAHLRTTQLEVEGVPADTVYTRQLDGAASLGVGYVFY